MSDEKNESKPINLAAAILQVMKEIKGVEKNLDVGTGGSAYKGVADKDVKKAIGEAMERAGLCILPIDLTQETEIDRWEAVESWNGKETTKRKKEVFTKVKTKYELLHISGESRIITGYGHGVDSMDKSAGKATTYALKYALLYLFMVPTGKIDDADKTQPKADTKKQLLNKGQFSKAMAAIKANTYTADELLDDYDLDPTQLKELNTIK